MARGGSAVPKRRYRSAAGRERKCASTVGRSPSDSRRTAMVIFGTALSFLRQLGDHTPDFARQERLLDHRAAALGDELAQRRGERVAGHEDHPTGPPGPAPLDLLIQRA